MANRVVHFEIEVKNKERAKKFYSQTFGWEMQDQGDEEYGGYVVAKSGEPNELGINGGIFQSGEKKLNAFRCVIGVDDIDKAIADVKSAGGKIYEDNKTPDGKSLGEKMDIPKIGIYAIGEDPDGNVFGILQPDLSSMPKP